MEVKIFGEWLREQWADDAMPAGVPTRPVKVPRSEEMEDKESFRRFLIEYRGDIQPGRQLLPNGSMFSVDMTGRSYETLDPPSDEHIRLVFCKLFYELKLGYVRNYIQDLTDAMSGLQQSTIQGEHRQWADAVHFEWPAEEIGSPPTDTDYQGLPCAISAKRRLKEIANFFKAKRDKLQREIAKLPKVIAHNNSLDLKEQMDMEARKRDMDYRAEFAKA